MDKTIKELESKKDQKMGVKETKKEFKCSYCDFKCERTVQLGHHKRTNHFKNKSAKPRKLTLTKKLISMRILALIIDRIV